MLILFTVVSAILIKKLGYDDQVILADYMETKDNLSDLLENYLKEHPEVDINTIRPNEKNIIAVLEQINK